VTRGDPNGGRLLLGVQGVSAGSGTARPLRDVSLDVDPGEALGVLGPRGSGKTALLNVISGFLRPERGRITFAGRDVTGWAPRRIARAGVARSFQAVSALNGADIGDVVLAAAVGRGLGARERREAVEEALTITGLASHLHRDSASLGPVEQRLVRLARVAAAAPRLALLDEPLAGLPPAGAGRVVSVLLRLRSAGIAMIVTGHHPASLRVVCSQAVLMRGGRIVDRGRPADMSRA